MPPEPTDDELRTFVAAALSNLDKLLREPEVIEDTIESNRHLWVALYRACSDFGGPAEAAAGA